MEDEEERLNLRSGSGGRDLGFGGTSITRLMTRLPETLGNARIEKFARPREPAAKNLSNSRPGCRELYRTTRKTAERECWAQRLLYSATVGTRSSGHSIPPSCRFLSHSTLAQLFSLARISCQFTFLHGMPSASHLR